MGVAAAPAVAHADVGGSSPTPADTQVAPDQVTAAAIAAAYGHRVEVSSLDAASSTTFVNADGTLSEDLSTTPVRVQQSDGSWKATDLTLQQNADGSISPAVSPVAVTIGAAGSRIVATLTVGSGSVSYGWSAALPAPTLSGSTATFANVEPGVNLVANVTTSGVETSVVFASAAAASAGPVELAVTASGLTASKDTTGVVSYADSSGSTVAQSPTPQAWDAERGGDLLGPGAGPVASVPSALTTTAGSVLSPTAGSGDVTSATGLMTDQLQVPTSLLNDPSTVYPLVLDPGVTCTNCTEGDHGYVENDGYNEINSSFDNGYVHVGTFDGGTTVTRGLLAFAQGEIHGQVVDSAILKLHNVYSWSCTGEPVTVYSSAAISTSSNWSNATVSGSGVPSGNFAYGYNSSCGANYYPITVTGIVSAAAASSSTAVYFQIRTDETNNLNWKKFDPTETLEVTWQSKPSVPGSLSVGGCWAKCTAPATTSDNTPALTAKSTTADGETLTYKYTVAGVGTESTISASASGALNTFNWGTLLSDGSHSYTVVACDYGSSVCSGPSAAVSFTVDTVHPATPTYGASDFDLTNGPTPQGQEYVAGNVTVNDTSSDVYEYAYSLIPGSITNPPVCNPSVGTVTSGSVTAVCGANISSGSAIISITPTGMTNTLTVEALDAAGNATSQSWTFTVNTLLASNPDHAWSTTNAQDGATSVSDWSGASPALPLTLTGNTSWVGANNGPNADDGLSFDGTFTGSTPTAASTAATSSLVIDSAHSVTVTAWVNPSAASMSDGHYHTAVAMDGAKNSQFYLQMAATGSAPNWGSAWRFCMPSTQTTAGYNQCTPEIATSSAAWTFIVGVWDSGAQTMTVYVNSTSTSASATHTSIPAAASGAITVGRAVPNTSYDANLWNLWSGQIADVTVYNGVLGTSQIQWLAQGNMPS